MATRRWTVVVLHCVEPHFESTWSYRVATTAFAGFPEAFILKTNSLGRGMIIAAWIGVLALLALLFQGALERRRAPELVSSSVNGGVVEVVVQRNRSGHYVVEGSVNGLPQHFLVDTGATAVALSQAAARRFQLARGAPVTLSTANGSVRGYRTRIDSLSVGDITMRDVAAVVSPGIDDGVALLGMSFLRRLELVQRDGLLLLRQVRVPAPS